MSRPAAQPLDSQKYTCIDPNVKAIFQVNTVKREAQHIYIYIHIYMTLSLPLDSSLGPHRLFALYPKVLHYFETLPRIALCDRAIVEHCASLLIEFKLCSFCLV